MTAFPFQAYRLFNGVLEEVTVVKEQISEGASVSTYQVRHKDNRGFYCSKDMYFADKNEAIRRYISEREESYVSALQSIIENTRRLQKNIESAQEWKAHLNSGENKV